jgi:hypothetical protein
MTICVFDFDDLHNQNLTQNWKNSRLSAVADADCIISGK